MTSMGTRVRPRVFDAFGREIVLDDEHQVLRDGMRVTIPLLLQDHDTIQKGDTKMNTDTVEIDGKTMTKDAAIEHLQGRLAATEALRTGAVRSDDAFAHYALGRQMVAQDRERKADTTTGYGDYVQRISNAWKTAGKVA